VGTAVAFLIVVGIITAVGGVMFGSFGYVAWNFIIRRVSGDLPFVGLRQALGLAMLLSFLAGCVKAAGK
jgi:hypothetical protein